MVKSKLILFIPRISICMSSKKYDPVYAKAWREKNKEKIREKSKRYLEKNKEKIKEDRIKNPEKYRAKGRKYYRSHKEKYITYNREKRRNDVGFRMKHNLCRRIHHSIKDGYKSAKTLELLGCSIEELKIHLQSQFKEGMSWDNYGIHGWHIDHIRPCALFDLTDPEEQKKCFNYSNLQPLWASDNCSKGARI